MPMSAPSAARWQAATRVLRSLRRTPLMLLSPARAGESHMDLRSMLHWSARWILRTTPEAEGESHGQVQESFSTPAGPSCGQCAARPAGGLDHCLGGDAVWGGDLLGHGRVWPGQGRAVAAVSAIG